ncbi:hypothetical protein BCU89_21920 [Vibrio splendidus]|nr:hypothetical protein BCU89_21920 [Vibrio splendidus]
MHQSFGGWGCPGEFNIDDGEDSHGLMPNIQTSKHPNIDNKSKSRSYCDHRINKTCHGIMNHQDNKIEKRTLKVGK